MAKLWKDMTTDERLDSMSARLDEITGVVIELEKQIRGLQAELGRQKGQVHRPVIKTAPFRSPQSN